MGERCYINDFRGAEVLINVIFLILVFYFTRMFAIIEKANVIFAFPI